MVTEPGSERLAARRASGDSGGVKLGAVKLGWDTGTLGEEEFGDPEENGREMAVSVMVPVPKRTIGAPVPEFTTGGPATAMNCPWP